MGSEEIAPGRFRLRGGDAPVEVRLIPLDGSGRVEVGERGGGAVEVDVVCWGASEVGVTMVLLAGRWAGAEVEWRPGEDMRVERAGGRTSALYW